MKLEDQVVSLELAKKLHEIGIKQASLFYWVKPIDEWLLTQVLNDEDKVYFIHSIVDIFAMEHYSAFTVAELGKILQDHPKLRMGYYQGADTHDFFFYDGDRRARISDESEANCRAKWILYLLDVKGVPWK